MQHNTYQENLYDHPANDPNDKERDYEFNGTRWTLVKAGEAGFWRIVPKSGACPEELEGQWTNTIQAERAIQRFVSQEPKKSTPYDNEVKKKYVPKVKLTPKEA